MRVLIGVLILSACAWRTHDRLRDWHSDPALFTAAVAVTPDLPRPHLNLGYALGRAGEADAAFQHTVTATRLARAQGNTWIQARTAQQFIWLDVLYGVCEPLAARPWCTP